jgi:hypothetical protein
MEYGMDDEKLDKILCPGDRPHRKRSADRKGVVEKTQCDRVLAFSSLMNHIPKLIVPCQGCGKLIEISQDVESGIKMIVRNKTHIPTIDTLKVVCDEQ